MRWAWVYRVAWCGCSFVRGCRTRTGPNKYLTSHRCCEMERTRETLKFDWSFLPSRLRDKLLPFQLKGVQYAIEKHGRCLIGDEMGLGKTLQAIAAAYYYHSEWPMLVVLPSSMKYPWIEELEKWLPCLQPNDINLISSSTDVSNIAQASVSLVGYGLMQSSFKTLTEALHKQEFKVIVVDESHFLKNPKAARTKTLVPLLMKAKRVLMLSGTPALARPSELFSQINCLRKGEFGSWSTFAKKYCNAQWKFYGRVRKWDTSGASNLNELHQKLTSAVMIRRQKKEVLSELPPKRRQKVPFELSESKQKKELDTIWEELGLYLKGEVKSKDGRDAGFEIRKLAMNLFISTGKAKIGAISEYVKMLLDNPEMKFLVFAHHKEVLTAIVQTVQAFAREKEPSLKYIRIDGDVPCSERMQDVNRFQQDPDVRVAALSIMAAGTGLTLTAATHVVFAELHWTPGVLEQCEDRAHRIGQANAIHVHYLIAKGTIDEWMWSALNKKVSVLSSTLNGQLQEMNVEVLGGGIGEFLKQAAFWLPSKLEFEEEDSFFFSQTPKKLGVRDIRSYMQSSQTSEKTSPVKSVTPKESHLPVMDISSDEETSVCQKETSMCKEENDDEILDLTKSKDEFESGKKTVRSKRKCGSDMRKVFKGISIVEETGVSYKETERLDEGAELKAQGCRVEMKEDDLKNYGDNNKERQVVASAEVIEIDDNDVSCHERKVFFGKEKLTEDKKDHKDDPFYESVENLTNDLLDAGGDKQNMIDSSISHTSALPSINNASQRVHNLGASDLSDSDCEVIVGVTSSQNYTPGCCQNTHSLDLENWSKSESSASPLATGVPSTETCLNYSDCNNVSGNQRNREHLRSQWNCPACTFLNHESLPLCEICETPRKPPKTSRVTRKMSKKKKVKQKKASQVTVVETLSESDEDFEVLQRVSLGSSGRNRMSTKMDNNISNKKETTETRKSSEVKVRVCDKFQNVSGMKSNLSEDCLSLSSNHHPDTVKIHCSGYRGWGEFHQSSDMSKLETKVVSKQKGKGPTSKTKQSCSDVFQGSKHGIDISESDSEDSILNMDLLNYDQQGLDINTNTEIERDDSQRHLVATLPKDSRVAEKKRTDMLQHPYVTDNVLNTKDDENNHKKCNSSGFNTSPGDYAHESSGSSMSGSSDPLFSDDEIMQESFNEKMKKIGKLESRKEVVLTQDVIENEVKDVLECLRNSPLTSQSHVEPWTCSELSCRHVNTTSDVECENCWTSKPARSSNSVAGFGSTKSPDFISASKFFTRHLNDVKSSQENESLKSSISQRTDKEFPSNTSSASPVTDVSQKGFKTEKGKGLVKLRQSTSKDSDINADVCTEPKVHESFLYCASKYTDRIYLYDEDQNPLNSAFFPLDLRICDVESLPPILQVKQNMKVARRFLKEWDSLTEMKKRKIKKSGLILDSPLAAIDALMKKRPFELSTKRFITKDDLANAALKKAEEVGGSFRVIHKSNTRTRLLNSPSASNCQFGKTSVPGRKRKDVREGESEDGDFEMRLEPSKKMKAAASIESSSKYSFVQALSADGTPLCVFCNGKIQNKNMTNDNAAWDTRYCSELCKHENQVRWKKSQYVREQLLDIEHGFCQMCGLDAHSIFKTIRDLPKSQRKKYLSETPYANLSVKQLNDMIRSPSEGQFWHADHIIPVYKGGGLCSLENYRTLCVLCHTKVTVEQGQERRKTRQEASNLKEGLRDIRNFLLDKG